MNPFEPLFWMGCVWVLLRAVHRGRPELLVWCGVLIGAGLENKHSTAFFLVSLLGGLLLAQERRLLRNRWFWVAAPAVIVLLALPNLIWQYQHHFATWVDLSNVKKTHKNLELPPLPFLRQQIMMLNPLAAPLWIAGLGFLLFHREGKRDRSLGVTYLLFLAIMMVLKGKDYHLAAIYPMLFAAGGVYWERIRGRATASLAESGDSGGGELAGNGGAAPDFTYSSGRQDRSLRSSVRNQEHAYRG
jgi:Dolichyl-phosphate-mannose-protein mannosyltransferase